MMIPTVFDWLERLAFLRGETAAYLAVLTAVVILLAWDWRVAVVGLMWHYLFAWLLLADLLDPRLAAVKLLAGLFVCLIFYWTARQLPPQALERQVQLGRLRLPASLPRRLVVTPLLLLLLLWLGQNPAYGLPGVPESLGYLPLAVYGLAGLGVLGMAATTDPWQASLGLFLCLTGFELFYHYLDQSVLVLALLAAVQLLAAVVVSYLAQGYRVARS